MCRSPAWEALPCSSQSAERVFANRILKTHGTPSDGFLGLLCFSASSELVAGCLSLHDSLV